MILTIPSDAVWVFCPSALSVYEATSLEGSRTLPPSKVALAINDPTLNANVGVGLFTPPPAAFPLLELVVEFELVGLPEL